MTVLLKGGMVYQNHEFVRADVRMQDGVIAAVGTGLSETDAQVVDVTGKRLVPGFLDIHTHGAVGVDVNAAKAEDYERFETLNGMECIECGSCTYVCPAKRPLTQTFKLAKAAVRETKNAK